ncbi:MAG: alpha-N-arabinofuranosidase, partial [Vallitaleaceae bacterium]|nr:alpha-N-arabinofuranosidase [Vallitaleaceae bacterium]
TYYPFQQVSNYGRGEVFQSLIVCDKVETEKFGKVDSLTAVTTYDEEKKEMAYFVLNTDQEEDIALQLSLREFGKLKMIDHEVLTGSDLFAVNSFENPEKVIPKKAEISQGENGEFLLTLPKLSWNMYRFQVEE